MIRRHTACYVAILYNYVFRNLLSWIIKILWLMIIIFITSTTWLMMGCVKILTTVTN